MTILFSSCHFFLLRTIKFNKIPSLTFHATLFCCPSLFSYEGTHSLISNSQVDSPITIWSVTTVAVKRRMLHQHPVTSRQQTPPEMFVLCEFGNDVFLDKVPILSHPGRYVWLAWVLKGLSRSRKFSFLTNGVPINFWD